MCALFLRRPVIGQSLKEADIIIDFEIYMFVAEFAMSTESIELKV